MACLRVGSGGGLEPPTDRTRTCCVADYTTPEWCRRRLARPAILGRAASARRRLARRAERSVRVAAEQPIGRRAGGPRCDLRPRRRASASPCRDFIPSASIGEPESDRPLDASTRTSRRARSTASRISPTRSVADHLLPRSSSIVELVVGDEEELHLLDDLHERRRALLRDADRGAEHVDVDTGTEARPRHRQHRAASSSSGERRMYSPFIHSSFSGSNAAATW